jgi:hypothetical protein
VRAFGRVSVALGDPEIDKNRSSGLASVRRMERGLYCVEVSGVDVQMTVPQVAIDRDASAGLEPGNVVAAEVRVDGRECDGKYVEVVTSRVVGDTLERSDEVGFTLLIP